MSIALLSTLAAHLTHPINIDYRGSDNILSQLYLEKAKIKCLYVCGVGRIYVKASTLLQLPR